jgi:hypothetical protein
LVSFVGVHPDVPIEEAAKLMPVNELAFCQSAESRLYSGFAQNYLMTYLPAAYPRWFLQGFGEMFATMKAGENFVEYAQLPPGFFQVMEHYGDYPVTHVLDGRYLSAKGRSWTPFHAWLLVHFLYFSDEWKPRLHDYLNALARGADLQSAARAFGNPAQLQRALTLVWKGTALAQLAVRAPNDERRRRLNEARGSIVKANRLAPEGILPLIAYYNSFAVAGEQAPDIAVEGLAKVVRSSPAAPSARLKLGEELIKGANMEGARNVLLPVAHGPFDTPERPAAYTLLQQVLAARELALASSWSPVRH